MVVVPFARIHFGIAGGRVLGFVGQKLELC